jgi:hypothetical protein
MDGVLPCSQNAHDKTVLVRCAQGSTLFLLTEVSWNRGVEYNK